MNEAFDLNWSADKFRNTNENLHMLSGMGSDLYLMNQGGKLGNALVGADEAYQTAKQAFGELSVGADVTTIGLRIWVKQPNGSFGELLLAGEAGNEIKLLPHKGGTSEAITDPTRLLEYKNGSGLTSSVGGNNVRIAEIGAGSVLAEDVVAAPSLLKYLDTEGVINYGEKDVFRRPTGISAILTPDTPKGTMPSNRKPLGFSKAQNHTRGHLLGAQLGGLGNESRNIVTQHENANAMSQIENEVKKEIVAGNVVEYSATPVYKSEIPVPFRAQNSPFEPKPGYSPNDLIPQGITIRANSSSGKYFEVSIPNTPAWGDWTRGEKPSKLEPTELWSIPK